MAEQPERMVKVARESPMGCNFLAKACLTLGFYLIWWQARQLVVTTRRVVWRSGVVGKSERSIPLSRVTDVSVKYGVLGRLLGYGNIYIESAGGPGTEIVALDIADPDGVRDAIVGQTQ
jgi:uncharacterized membrane protein YdbT with pleckstrin-like domain